MPVTATSCSQGREAVERRRLRWSTATTRRYSELVSGWAQLDTGMTAWDLYGGAGVFAAVLAQAVGETGRVVTVDTSRGASRSARAALADFGWVSVVTDSVRRALALQRERADVA